MAAAVSVENAKAQQLGKMNGTDKDIAALEERIAHQDRILEDLSEMSVKLWKVVSDLSDQVGYLKLKLQELESGDERSPGREPPPPHY